MKLIAKQLINRDSLIETLKDEIIKEIKSLDGELTGSWIQGEPHLLITPESIISFSDIDILCNKPHLNPKYINEIKVKYNNINILFNKLSYKDKSYDVDLYVQSRIYDSLNSDLYDIVYIFWFYVAVIEYISNTKSDPYNQLRRQYFMNKIFLHLFMNTPTLIFKKNKNCSLLASEYLKISKNEAFCKTLFDVKTGNHDISFVNETDTYINEFEHLFNYLYKNNYLKERTCLEMISILKVIDSFISCSKIATLSKEIRKNITSIHDEKIVKYQLGKLFNHEY
ncbi:hypothetical protein VB264_15770 [Arcicella aquatica]|uniref:Nucleotidyltransferase n=1 Tax=Arcicella aquatica TaxID=217141 RepID=A0ABU5QR70_9BACT|nr:hypothetical protein [Arcicella aquatica]MEA5259255.1 hypothetical protein [Arcicella aquatica]